MKNYTVIEYDAGYPERLIWTVGFYDSNGEWQAESDHYSPEAANARIKELTPLYQGDNNECM